MDEVFSSLEKLSRKELFEVEEKIKELLENFEEREKYDYDEKKRKIENKYFKKRQKYFKDLGQSAKIQFDGIHDMYKELDGYSKLTSLYKVYHNQGFFHRRWFKIVCGENSLLREKYTCIKCKESSGEIFRSIFFREKMYCEKCVVKDECHKFNRVDDFKDFEWCV